MLEDLKEKYADNISAVHYDRTRNKKFTLLGIEMNPINSWDFIVKDEDGSKWTMVTDHYLRFTEVIK